MDSNKEPQLVEHDFEFYIFALTAASTFLKWNIAHSFSYVGKLQKNTMCYYKVTNKKKKLGPGHTSTISIETLSIDMDFKYRQ